MRQEKTLLLDEIKQKIDGSLAFVLTKYGRLDPNTSASFRNRLRDAKSSFEVVKKRVLLKAAEAAGVTLPPDVLDGHVAVVFAEEDPVQTTKALFQFTKENEDLLKILGGRFEGKLISAKDVEQISKLPSKDEMRAQFLGTLEAPLSQTLAVMEALLTSILYCLENKKS